VAAEEEAAEEAVVEVVAAAEVGEVAVELLPAEVWMFHED
jgi:hypothetical protein